MDHTWAYWQAHSNNSAAECHLFWKGLHILTIPNRWPALLALQTRWWNIACFCRMKILHRCAEVSWDFQASHDVSHSWQSLFPAHISSSLCFLDIWVLPMINSSYVLRRTRPNLCSACRTKSFHSLLVSEVVSRTECSHARKLCQGLLWMD